MKPRSKPPTQAPSNPARQAFLRAHTAGRHEEALAAAERAVRQAPGQVQHWVDAATACVYLHRYAQALPYAERALRLGGASFSLFDALAHIHGALNHPDQVRQFGTQALAQRDQQFGATTQVLPALPPLPAPPSAATRGCNLIAFSLFGGLPRYCEPAVINAQACMQLYPGWTCRFYTDDSVPPAVLERLRAAGAQVVPVDALARAWPGPMWRLLAADEPGVHRVLFRDADAILSEREAGAVQQWVASDRHFHLMRDACTHTELLLAGLWGMVGGSLAPLQAQVARYLQQPEVSPRFADQWFLRSAVWPVARRSLLSHDSQFGFMQALPFPQGPAPPGFHVGMDEGSARFAAQADLPDGTPVRWRLYFLEPSPAGQRKVLVCSYQTVVQGGRVQDNVPRRYLDRLRQGTATIEAHPNTPATA
jgi:hypothetical protein